jgi:hypothetical protein
MAAAVSLAAGCTSSHSPGQSQAGQPTSPVSPRVTAGADPVLGVKWDASRTAQFASYLRSIAGVTFTEVVWCTVEPRRGTWDWSKTDAAVTGARNLGFTVYLKLRTGSCWVNSDRGGHARGAKTASAYPDSTADYDAFLRAAVSRYWPSGVREFAIENEVNALSMWNGSVDDYVRLVRHAAPVITAAERGALVADCGLGSTTYGVGIADRLLRAGAGTEAVAAYNRYYAQRFSTRSSEFPRVADVAGLQHALAGTQAQRDLALLSATRQLEVEGTVNVRQLHYYEDWSALPDLVSFLQATVPSSVPVQAWEVGAFSPDVSATSTQRAAAVTKATGLLLAGGIRPVIWLPLAVDPGGRHADEPRYGLLDPSGAVRPAGAAFARLAQAGRGVTVRGLTPPFSGVILGASSHSMVLLWDDTSSRALQRPAALTEANDVTGAPVSWPSGGLRVGALPVVLQLATSVTSALGELR